MSSEGKRSEWGQVRTWVGHACILAAINVLLGLLVLQVHDGRLHYTPWETDSVLLCMPEDTAYDLVVLGASHAYLLSRFEEHHAMMEETLGMRTFNMAMPSGGGVLPARLYLETFLERGNTARHAVYFLDPFVFFSPACNEAHKLVYFEPFQFRFFWKLLRNGYPVRRLFTYLQSKFTYAWLFQPAQPLDAIHASLEGTPLTRTGCGNASIPSIPKA